MGLPVGIKIKAIVALGIALGLGACATVDMAEITPTKRTASLNLQQDKNLVVQSSDKIYKHLVASGLAQSTESKFKRLTSVLLKGRQLGQTSPASQYAAKAHTQYRLISDVNQVSAMVETAHQAAILHIDVVAVDADLITELKALERALNALEEAQASFDYVIDTNSFDTANASLVLETAVSNLKSITNDYGDRVRADTAKTKAPAS